MTLDKASDGLKGAKLELKFKRIVQNMFIISFMLHDALFAG